MNMSEILGCVVAVITIFSFLCVVVKWAIIEPLNRSIGTLTVAVNDLKALVEDLQNSEHSLDNRLTAVETIMKAHGCDHIKYD